MCREEIRAAYLFEEAEIGLLKVCAALLDFAFLFV